MVAEMITKIGIPSDAELFLRVIVASVLGYMIGYERKNRDKSAGMRTHAIVALGAALMMVVSKYGFYDVEKVDSSRVAAQIVSGVGFLGAGVIFVRNNTVSGLTTAAGLWTTAGVGMAVGAGKYGIGVCAGILVVAIQEILHRTSFLTAEPIRGFLKMTCTDYENVIADIQMHFSEEKVKISNLKVGKGKNGTKIELEVVYPPLYDKNAMLLKFDQPEEIIDFVRIMNRYECDADVKYGSMVVDAKSIVGVLSLARSKTVEVILHTDECQNLLDEIAQFAA